MDSQPFIPALRGTEAEESDALATETTFGRRSLDSETVRWFVGIGAVVAFGLLMIPILFITGVANPSSVLGNSSSGTAPLPGSLGALPPGPNGVDVLPRDNKDGSFNGTAAGSGSNTQGITNVVTTGGAASNPAPAGAPSGLTSGGMPGGDTTSASAGGPLGGARVSGASTGAALP